MKHKGELKLNGKTYQVEVINGERFIDGKTVDEFLDTCDPITLSEFVKIGKQALSDAKSGVKKESYQKMMDDMNKMKNN